MPPMMQERLSGPPPGPTPQGLTSMLPQGGPRPDGLGEPNPSAGGAKGGLKDVFDEVQSILNALASILPEQADEIDEIQAKLSEILAKAISGGTPFQGRTGEGPAPGRPTPTLPV